MKIILILLLLPFIGACGADAGGNPHEGPTQHAKGVIISESQKGDSQWLLKAKEAVFDDDKQSIRLTNPILDFTEKDKSVSNLTADDGIYEIKKDLIILTGNVTGISPMQDTVIQTEKAYYNTKKRDINVYDPVKITRAGVKLNGQGLKANSDFSQIEIIKHKTQLPKDKAGFGAMPDDI